MTRWLVMIVLVSATLGACSTDAADPIVDGWPIGPAMACGAAERCPELIDVARRRLDGRDPGHADVVEATLHAEGTLVDANGGKILMTRSGACCAVAVFELADSSVKAIGVGSPGVDPETRAFDYGP